MDNNIIILGGGQTAAYAAKEIRSIDHSIPLTIISEDNYLPYERPPLSKDCLLEKKIYDQILFFPKNFYEENKINFILNKKITNVDFEKNKIISDNGEVYNYNKLLIATGSKNRQIKIDNTVNNIENDIIYLRDIKDSKKIRNRLKFSNELIIVGGGFIGLEIASAASQLGKKVSVIEMGKQLMGRAIPSQIAKLVQWLHKENGNNIFLDTQIKNINRIDNSYEVILNSNIKICCDLIIAGIGSLANTDLFLDTSIKTDNGIITDEFCQTSVPNVFAAGDVANFFHPFYRKNIRLESYQHAQNHGINAGKNILGVKTTYNNIPWMWSDQFDYNLQMIGICDNYEKITQRGTDINEGIIYFFIKNRKIMGACGLGISGKIGRDIKLAGKISEKKIEIKEEILSDKNMKLNILLS